MRARATALALALAAAAGAGCSTVDLGDPPADVNACRPSQAFFVAEIWPNFLGKTYNGKSCGDSMCHDAAAGRQLKVVAPTSTPTPSTPLAIGSDWEAAYLSAARQMRCTNVRGGDLYTRPAGLRSHGGGQLIQPDGSEALLLDQWVTAP